MEPDSLADTNIFLEVILRQERVSLCESILREREKRIAISDFSLHSMGIYLFRTNREHAFLDFLNDIDGLVTILGLELKDYPKIYANRKRHNLDYDDSYQLTVAENFGIELLTLDKDFRGVESPIKITVLH
jgi:predicted nucleic acid-binding protein